MHMQLTHLKLLEYSNMSGALGDFIFPVRALLLLQFLWLFSVPLAQLLPVKFSFTKNLRVFLFLLYFGFSISWILCLPFCYDLSTHFGAHPLGTS